MLPDHIALLVHSVHACLERISETDLVIGEVDDFPSEGTREVYIGGANQSAKLLLIESRDPNGPYGRALSKRGPGLHHICFRVPQLRPFIDTLAGTGWMLLPHSLKTLEQSHTGWLGRPGVGTLLEVVEGKPPMGEPIVTGLQVRMPSANATMLEGLGWSDCTAVAVSDHDENGAQHISFGGRRWDIEELVTSAETPRT